MMEAFYILLTVGLIHFVFFFFNTIFTTCMHLPYIMLLKKSGLSIQFMQIKWFTNIFNRSLMKWSLNRSKFWHLWYNIGLYTTMILFPISIVIILKTTLNNQWLVKTEFANEKKEKVIDVMIPGVDIPYNQMSYYVLSLLISSIVHELGHAIAAVNCDVRFFGMGLILFFIIPVAFVHINDDQLQSSPAKNHLKILCAGIWHNVVLAIVAILLMQSVYLSFEPFFNAESGVYVKGISPKSMLSGPSGLSVGDGIYKINDCNVKNLTNWRTCILQLTQVSNPGYCVADNLIKETNKYSTLHLKNDIYDCCDELNKDKGFLCFEKLDSSNQESKIAKNVCVPTRTIIESSHSTCQNSDHCLLTNDICIRPTLDNVTKVLRIQRYGCKDVLFIGHPSEIYYSLDVSNWIPKLSFVTPDFPESIILFCKYMAVFSSGLAIINVIPCFYFDGQHITVLLIDSLLKNKISQKSRRAMISLIITTIFTLLLLFNFLKAYADKV